MNPDPHAIEGRLFLAIPLTSDVRAGLTAHLAAASTASSGLPGRRVTPENWHFTLRFLGDTRAAEGARLHAGLRDAAEKGRLGEAFSLRFGRLGAFPKPERARVLWLGVAGGAAAIIRLAVDVERETVAAGFPSEAKPFAPHLTLSRLEGLDVRELVASTPPFDAAMGVSEVVLFRSHLGQGPPRYEALVRYALKKAEG